MVVLIARFGISNLRWFWLGDWGRPEFFGLRKIVEVGKSEDFQEFTGRTVEHRSPDLFCSARDPSQSSIHQTTKYFTARYPAN